MYRRVVKCLVGLIPLVVNVFGLHWVSQLAYSFMVSLVDHGCVHECFFVAWIRLFFIVMLLFKLAVEKCLNL